ncbi:tripartite tricarboxylate transporter substrate binding protein [Martelella mediterranea]|uniref:Tripartite tricarboxylate transporter family receptor n=1 Tax=Martelella mediterranea DSM 17316 TaxID=1122214 RepID=A0A1U9Z823_9HYPH|nr:tripartite tricarboxylate transporter substrate binding protein [Martelella mediterranea]AQZ53869.1 Tripartite tricarboxylate transporter family receptor [Martelella mediterranea DSM 17316]|tara:strand:- start:5 stop:964 length:960 start_codon:yes stop_codon:yes gene_type:complete
MNFSRTKQFAACALAALMLAPAAARAEYPEKPVQIIVPFGAGDAIDGTARVIARQLQNYFGKPFIVRNVDGAGGSVGTLEAAKAPADGYTLLIASTGALTARPIMAEAGYQTDDFIPLAELVETPIAVAVAADSPLNSISDIVEKAKSEDVTFSTPGPGSSQHVSMSDFADQQGIELTHISGQGGKGAVTKALSGEVDFSFVGAPVYKSLAQAGQLKVIGLAADEEVDYLPGAKTFKAQGFDFTASVWFGLVTRKGTPDDVIAKLDAALKEIAASDELAELYSKFSYTDAFRDSAGFAAVIEASSAQNRKVLTELGLAK